MRTFSFRVRHANCVPPEIVTGFRSVFAGFAFRIASIAFYEWTKTKSPYRAFVNGFADIIR
jgi:hypothetical protein